MPSTDLLQLLVALAWGTAAASLVVAIRRRGRQRVRARLYELHLAGQSRPSQSPGIGWRGVPQALGRRLASRAARRVERLRSLGESAGLAGRVGPEELLGWQVVLGVLGLVLGLASVPTVQGFGLPLVLGWMGPELWLRRRRASRRRAILRDLPTVVDLLALGLEAGMGLDRALRMIGERFESPLSEELKHVLSDISLGVSRQEAFTRMAARVEAPEIRLLVTSIIQSEQLGTALLSMMKNQAHQIRVARRHHAEAQAFKAPTKMAFPMVGFVLPVLFIVVLGPPALQLGQAVGRGHP